MNAYIIANPTSGRLKIQREIYTISVLFAQNGYRTLTHLTTGAGDAADYAGKAAADADMIVCCGGDGTLNEVISGILAANRSVPIGYIPAGTTNDFAGSLNIPCEIIPSARAILSGTPEKFDIGSFMGRTFVYVASFGAFSKCSYSTPQKLKNSLGHLAYVIEGMKDLPEMRPCRMKLTTDDGTVEGNFIYGSISNTRSIGGILKLDESEVDLADGKFEYLLIRQPDSLVALISALRSITEKTFSDENVIFGHTSFAEICCAEPVPWSLDGEYQQGAERISVENLH